MMNNVIMKQQPQQRASSAPNFVEKYMTAEKLWLSETSVSFPQMLETKRIEKISLPYWPYISPSTTLGEITEGKICIISQFYIDKISIRQEEIKKCLHLNVQNNNIDKIYLLNEREFTPREMGIQSNKIIQINIGERLKYNTVFDIIEKHKIEGYIVLCNSDIFFDASIVDVKRTNMTKEKLIYCQLRYEYDGKIRLKDCKLFGPRSDSQDVWIFHSNQIIPQQQRKLFSFQLGTPSCDNKVTYLWNILGYQCRNEPTLFKSYHYHVTQIRNYDRNTKKTPTPWVTIHPSMNPQEKIDPDHTFNMLKENDYFREYLREKIDGKKQFIIPRIAGIENNYAQLGAIINQNRKIEPQQKDYINKTAQVIKNNAGLRISDLNGIIKYSQIYLEAFHKCDLYLDWEPWGNVYRAIQGSHEFITTNFKKKRVWAFTLDIFHHIHNNPWTLALKGQRLLIISPFVNSFKEKIVKRKHIYGIDLFPECTFVFLKPPQTQADNPSEEFNKELDKFMKEVEKIKDTFDIALCSCGGYGNLVCACLHEMGKSSIYMGGVLQMYFGVYGARWLRERPDIMNLYLNEYWSRPKEEEKPKGYEKVEGSCYW